MSVHKNLIEIRERLQREKKAGNLWCWFNVQSLYRQIDEVIKHEEGNWMPTDNSKEKTHGRHNS